MTPASYERSTEDQGNIISFEHVNVQITDQRLATLFYVGGLGLTRDPYMNVIDSNMWINAGRNQFHLPTGRPQVLRGTTGLVLSNLDDLRQRLKRVAPKLAETKFSWQDEGSSVLASCPWGNRIRIHQAGAGFGRMQLGIAYVEFLVARGAAEGIAQFYRTALRAPAWVETANGLPLAKAKIKVGMDQHLVFRETDEAIAEYDGHHLAMYVSDFSGPHAWLNERGAISEESDAYQYRFEAIIDPASGKELFRIQHEVRSLSHPMFMRQWSLANRNPMQGGQGYGTGRDGYYPEPGIV